MLVDNCSGILLVTIGFKPRPFRLNWINSLISHNFSGSAFSSLLSMFLFDSVLWIFNSGRTEKGNFLKNWTCCFTPTQDESHSVSPPKPIPNWVEEVDLPTEDQNDTINDLRDKCAILLESFSKNQSRDRFTWQDIAQRLVLEGKGTTAEVGATREDFQRLLGEFKNPERRLSSGFKGPHRR
ncbi:hypothetical protein VNO77_46929 [Canavalia gladiata]|uniref:Uncharacterized protein n=1 Tax=Canavalia gladiata TaxID=3824 RepID=A0AAN9JIS4_CANGL